MILRDNRLWHGGTPNLPLAVFLLFCHGLQVKHHALPAKRGVRGHLVVSGLHGLAVAQRLALGTAVHATAAVEQALPTGPAQVQAGLLVVGMRSKPLSGWWSPT